MITADPTLPPTDSPPSSDSPKPDELSATANQQQPAVEFTPLSATSSTSADGDQDDLEDGSPPTPTSVATERASATTPSVPEADAPLGDHDLIPPPTSSTPPDSHDPDTTTTFSEENLSKATPTRFGLPAEEEEDEEGNEDTIPPAKESLDNLGPDENDTVPELDVPNSFISSIHSLSYALSCYSLHNTNPSFSSQPPPHFIAESKLQISEKALEAWNELLQLAFTLGGMNFEGGQADKIKEELGLLVPVTISRVEKDRDGQVQEAGASKEEKGEEPTPGIQITERPLSSPTSQILPKFAQQPIDSPWYTPPKILTSPTVAGGGFAAFSGESSPLAALKKGGSSASLEGKDLGGGEKGKGKEKEVTVEVEDEAKGESKQGSALKQTESAPSTILISAPPTPSPSRSRPTSLLTSPPLAPSSPKRSPRNRTRNLHSPAATYPPAVPSPSSSATLFPAGPPPPLFSFAPKGSSGGLALAGMTTVVSESGEKKKEEKKEEKEEDEQRVERKERSAKQRRLVPESEEKEASKPSAIPSESQPTAAPSTSTSTSTSTSPPATKSVSPSRGSLFGGLLFGAPLFAPLPPTDMTATATATATAPASTSLSMFGQPPVISTPVFGSAPPRPPPSFAATPFAASFTFGTAPSSSSTSIPPNPPGLMPPPLTRQWYYLTPTEGEKGPFPSSAMQNWLDRGLLADDLKVRGVNVGYEGYEVLSKLKSAKLLGMKLFEDGGIDLNRLRIIRPASTWGGFGTGGFRFGEPSTSTSGPSTLQPSTSQAPPFNTFGGFGTTPSIFGGAPSRNGTALASTSAGTIPLFGSRQPDNPPPYTPLPLPTQRATPVATLGTSTSSSSTFAASTPNPPPLPTSSSSTSTAATTSLPRLPTTQWEYISYGLSPTPRLTGPYAGSVLKAMLESGSLRDDSLVRVYDSSRGVGVLAGRETEGFEKISDVRARFEPDGPRKPGCGKFFVQEEEELTRSNGPSVFLPTCVESPDGNHERFQSLVATESFGGYSPEELRLRELQKALKAKKEPSPSRT